ncbi:zf-HC2 domain-containing protein [Alcanivorax sp. 1008]|uniref:anti-sigma factor family protein n=1 Tax=Alcanivorax sp. 1008 TaxID=2816853 RepID=UPI001D750025|nr:zf-HC2 domain-containing protein [Alcanivorax sp. 1008]MCC1496349.1 zf-HC2 domain-containing protein [Alcanivorax sp. 1008]
MLKCRDVPAEAEALLDGELSLGRRVALRFHLFMCGNCRRYLGQLRLLLGAVPQMHGQASDEEVDQVLKRLHDHSH